MPVNMRLLSIVGGSLLGLAFIFYIVSNAVPSWSRIGSEGYESTFGLWKTCSSIRGEKEVCVPFKCPQDGDGENSNSCNKILAARAFITLACIVSAISALCLFASAVVNDDLKRLVLLAAKGLVFACLVIGIIGVAIGINVTNGTDTEVKLTLGAAAIIGIIAIIINLGGAIVTVLIK